MAASYTEQPESPTSKKLKSFTTRDCIALGAFTTSPIQSLYKEVNEPPLSLRRYKLALQYYTKLISWCQNSAYNYFMEIRYKNLFENKAKALNSLI